jgi:hypothetical protein
MISAGRMTIIKVSTEDDESGDNIVPTTHKLEFPKYDGAVDPLPWINRCEKYFRVQRTPEHKRVAYTAFHLLDDAQLWFHRLELNGGQPDWTCFMQLVNARFGPPLMNSSIGELAQLRHIGSVDEYCNKFMSMSCRDTTLTEPQQMQLFITGLKNPLRTDVALMQPATLADVIVFAWAYEQRDGSSSTTTPTQPRSPTRSTTRPAASTLAQSAASSVASSPATVSKPSTTLQLMLTKIAERRLSDTCFRCNEKFTSGHHKECKKLFGIEVLCNDYKQASDESLMNPTISLHTLTGIQPRAAHTMQLTVQVGAAALTALLDSGSTHNFIDVDVARWSPSDRSCGIS